MTLCFQKVPLASFGLFLLRDHPQLLQYSLTHQEKQPHSLNLGRTLFAHTGWEYIPGTVHTPFSRYKHAPPSATDDSHPAVIAYVARAL